MFQLNEISLENLIVYHIGSKTEDEGIHLSNTAVDLNDDQLQVVFMQYFLSPFKPGEMFHLSHKEQLDNNEIFASRYFLTIHSKCTTFSHFYLFLILLKRS